ncbi:IS701 family transposase [Caldimonas tepidiphila]|uniref:IS701 family transposase n=1 Tax=Caldimonas tepidiphila TaxID=2315841 RepID=UPI000E5A2960|nr:IS701 family transposase [Caldimonas tepidiphila]
MDSRVQFDEYMAHLAAGLGHADRVAGLRNYCTGLMLPLSRKSVEPMAARLDPLHASARHQALHHFVAKAEWSDAELLRRVAQWVVPRMNFSAGGYWLIDDTSFPKKGRHSVGVARQWCGVLGKQDNCLVAVSVSLANEQASLPVAWRLYLPEEWAEDEERRRKAGVPEDVRFATKTEIALNQLQTLLDEGAPRYCVVADAGYGVDAAFRQRLTDMGLHYMAGVTSSVMVWPPGMEPLLPKPWSGRGRHPIATRRSPDHKPMSVGDLAQSLPNEAFSTITWRQGSNEPLTGRFAALRVRHAGPVTGKQRLHPLQWLLIEWPENKDEPRKYWLSTLDESAPLHELVRVAHLRWRIERDYQDLKQDLGLGHYEGRGWRGFHHHASLAIAAYGFLVAQRLSNEHNATDGDREKNLRLERRLPALPRDYVPRGARSRAASYPEFDHDAATAAQRLPAP